MTETLGLLRSSSLDFAHRDAFSRKNMLLGPFFLVIAFNRVLSSSAFLEDMNINPKICFLAKVL